MLIELDYKDRRPIYEQVTEKLEGMILVGVLQEDSQLPSVRNMAVALSINPYTIQRAYAELERKGYIYSVKGKGSFVADSSRLRVLRQEEACGRLREASREAAILGVPRERILDEAAAGADSAEKRTGGNEND